MALRDILGKAAHSVISGFGGLAAGLPGAITGGILSGVGGRIEGALNPGASGQGAVQLLNQDTAGQQAIALANREQAFRGSENQLDRQHQASLASQQINAQARQNEMRIFADALISAQANATRMAELTRQHEQWKYYTSPDMMPVWDRALDNIFGRDRGQAGLETIRRGVRRWWNSGGINSLLPGAHYFAPLGEYDTEPLPDYNAEPWTGRIRR